MIARVLLAEGDEALRTKLDEFLTLRLLDVDVAGSATDCLYRLRQTHPDALVLDLELKWGGADGVLTVMREEPELSRIPVILTSSTMNQSELSSLVKAPVVQALCKPYVPRALLQRLLNATRSKHTELWLPTNDPAWPTTRWKN